MQNNRAFDLLARRRFKAIALVMGQLSFLDELIQDVLDLFPGGRGSGVKIVENLPANCVSCGRKVFWI